MLDGRQAPSGSSTGNVSFEKGIRDGIVLPVDDKVRSEEEALLRPSLADLEPILHATPYENSISSRHNIHHVEETMNQVVKLPSQAQGKVFEEYIPQPASGTTKLAFLGPEDGFKRKESTSSSNCKSSHRSSQLLSTTATSLDPSYTGGRKEFNLLSRTESSWSSSAPRLTSNSTEVRPLHTPEYIPSHGPLPPSSDHRYPEPNLEESNEYTLAPTSQSLGQWPACHTFSSDDEDLRPRPENIPRAAIQPKNKREKIHSSTRYHSPTSSDDVCHIRSFSGNFPNVVSTLPPSLPLEI
jgi:hypothetical protein